uniref:Uncharacterized protein n=1 Tax=Populus trichocarpa TaxID=3694 RepID=A0A3N7FSY1_POPTR
MEYFKLSSFLFLIIYFLLFSLSQHHPNNSANSYLIQTTDTHFFSLFLIRIILQSLPHPFFFAFSASPYFIPPKNTRDRFHYN